MYVLILLLYSRPFSLTYCRPHSRKEAKLDTKTKLHQLNELAELYNCNNVLFFEARKGQDLYAWMSKAPNGPTVKMHLQNLHTMEELNFIGNCLKGSRPVLSFDAAFEKQAHTRLMGFTLAGGKIWVRVYQINESEPGKKKPVDGEEMDVDPAPKKKGKTEFDVQLVEIGPRFVLTPIVIQESSFGGPIIYENKEFVSPNQIRADLRRAKAGKFNRRTEAAKDSKIRRGDLGLTTHGGLKKEQDPLSDSVLFA